MCLITVNVLAALKTAIVVQVLQFVTFVFPVIPLMKVLAMLSHKIV